MNVSDFEALPSKEQEQVLAGLDGVAQRDLRNRVRLIRCQRALGKAQANMENPGYPDYKRERCAERIAQYETSIKNLTELGVEVVPSGNPIGNDVDVPLGELGKSANSAEVSAS